MPTNSEWAARTGLADGFCARAVTRLSWTGFAGQVLRLGLAALFLPEAETQFSSTTIYSDGSPVPAELCVDREPPDRGRPLGCAASAAGSRAVIM
jgi:hypothetical protein